MAISVPLIAGGISTMIYASGVLPMLVKAFRTKDLGSYSLGNILLANVGNIVNSVYIFDLPLGPIWLLHSFYLVTTGLMLAWYLRYAQCRRGSIGDLRRHLHSRWPAGDKGLLITTGTFAAAAKPNPLMHSPRLTDWH